jgi:uncharacterized protein
MTIQDLKNQNLLLLELVSGSKAYGLDTATSDTDIKGVFYLPKEKFYGMEYTPQINNETNDEVYYELGRFVELLVRNNPNILEMLASPEDCILFRHPLMNLLPMKMFLSKQCRETFAGYAQTQIKKARGYKKKVVNPVELIRKSVEDFCYVVEGNQTLPFQYWLESNNYFQQHCGLTSIAHTKGLYAIFYDEEQQFNYRGVTSSQDANDVSLSSIPKGEKQIALLYFNVEHYSSYCKEYREYWNWVEKRNDVRYTANKDHGKDYDAKNMMHTIRLLQVAEEILKDGQLNVKRKNRNELLAIKNGALEYDELLTMAEELEKRIDDYHQTSKLQEQANTVLAEAALIAIRTELYK